MGWATENQPNMEEGNLQSVMLLTDEDIN